MSDDQDTTAPGKVGITIKLVEVDTSPERFAYHGWEPWATFLAECLYDAALEEMRVRAALKRAGMDENGQFRIGLNRTEL